MKKTVMQPRRPSLGGAIAGILLAASLAGTTSAGPLAEAAARAEELAASGDAKGAYEAIRGAFGDFSETLPFSVGFATFVSDKPAAYGAYTARPDSVFKPGEPLVTYLELIGLSWKDAGDGKEQSNFTVDLELADAKGEALAQQKGFGNFSFTGHVRNQEIYTHLTLDVTGAPPGDYVLRYVVNDVHGQRSTTLEQPFTIKAP